MDLDTQKIRSFNRTVTQRLGALNERYLGRDRPLVESRVLFEIGTAGVAVTDLRARLNLDSGFLSRLLRSLERKGFASTARRSAHDGRARFASLTRRGVTELGRINALSDELARSMLRPLTKEQQQRLVAATSEVEHLLRASSVEIAQRDPSSPEATRCFDRYFADIASRFSEGFDRTANGFADAKDFAPPRGCVLIASLFGESVGCSALRTLEPGIGEIKRMWVAPSARGLGIGRRFLHELEGIARRRRMRAIRLDTNRSLNEALQLYRSSGYREIGRFNDNPYAHHWFEKVLA